MFVIATGVTWLAGTWGSTKTIGLLIISKRFLLASLLLALTSFGALFFLDVTKHFPKFS